MKQTAEVSAMDQQGMSSNLAHVAFLFNNGDYGVAEELS